MKKIYVPRKEFKPLNVQNLLIATVAFLFGCILTASVVLNVKVTSVDPNQEHHVMYPPPAALAADASKRSLQNAAAGMSQQQVPHGDASISPSHVLQGVRVLVVIAAFDFSQIPHLEEVVDSYHDVCTTGAEKVDIFIHTTIPWPITLIDLWNTRFACPNFSVTIVVKPKALRLHLVDCHRETFYNNIDNYDLFIYTEDDIRVRPTTVATYLVETEKIKRAVATSSKYSFADFNVGIVRYEYNYPANIIIDDNTRHATQNVTRVFWEHSGFKRPVIPGAIKILEQEPLQKDYITMKNHHQGMFLATHDLLLAWKKRCEFDVATNRPGRGAQPTEGTQRVW